MVNTEIRLIIFFAAKDGEALYSQQKQDQDLTVAQIMNFLLPNSGLNWRKLRKLLDHSVQLSSVTQSSDSLRPHESQHARPPCPSSTPGVYSNSCPLSQWCHPTISSSVIPFSSCPQSFRAWGLFRCVSSSYQVAKVLEFQLQHQTFQWTSRTYL